MENREALEQQLRDLEGRKRNVIEGENPDQVAVARLNAQISEVRQQLSAIDTREAIIAGTEDPESPFVLSVGEYSVDFLIEAASEQSYQALRIVTQLKLQEMEEQNQAEIKALKVSYESERQQYELQIDNLESQKVEAQQVIEGYKRDLRELDGHLYNANLQLADRDSKLSIAANEIDSLKAQVEDLRNQVSKPTVPTNMDSGALAEAMKRLRESKPAIYNVVEVSGVKATGILVETNETIEFHPNYIGKYRVVSFEEATNIRAELEAAKADIPEAEPVSEVIEVPQFSEVPEDNTGSELAGDTTETESLQNHDGRETFEQRTERRLAVLEAHAFGEVKAVA